MNINHRMSVNCFCLLPASPYGLHGFGKGVTAHYCSGLSVCKQHCTNSKCGERFRFFSNSFPNLFKTFNGVEKSDDAFL